MLIAQFLQRRLQIQSRIDARCGGASSPAGPPSGSSKAFNLERFRFFRPAISFEHRNLIDQNPAQPRLDARPLFEFRQALERAGECFLHDIFRVGRVGQQRIRQAKQRASMTIDQRVERPAIAASGPAEQIQIGRLRLQLAVSVFPRRSRAARPISSTAGLCQT